MRLFSCCSMMAYTKKDLGVDELGCRFILRLNYGKRLITKQAEIKLFEILLQIIYYLKQSGIKQQKLGRVDETLNSLALRALTQVLFLTHPRLEQVEKKCSSYNGVRGMALRVREQYLLRQLIGYFHLCNFDLSQH